MSQRPPRPQPTDAPLRTRLVFGWSLFFVLVVVGLVAAFWSGRSVPVLLDVIAP